ncbi:fasciclin domain-containing protein [Yoonia sp. 2307UL14-13]|uniref:fasciclin domain-containing protein n=1 Tax=Yoonia sp. 2307UL14-13 TaxID=3126506 RepID=UPI003095100E
MRTLTTTALVGATLIAGASLANADIKNEYLLSDELTITENAAKVQNFSTLMAAVEAAGLADDLMGEGPFTIFAPTDEAFAALPEGTVEELLKPENIGQLEELLKAHVVPGVVTSEDIDLAAIGSDVAEIGELDVEVMDGKVMMDSLVQSDIAVEKIGDAFYVSAYATSPSDNEPEASIIEANIMASNGVIHVIDNVLTPDS